MTVRSALVLSLALALAATARGDTINFGDLTLPVNSYYNGSDGAGGFASGGASFNNSYTAAYGSWSGWSYSNVDDTTTPGYTNQYSAITGTAPAGNPTGIYAVAYVGPAYINLPAGESLASMEVTNTTYTYLDVANGDPYGFDQKYGPGDFLTLQVLGMSGLNGGGTQVGEVDVDLANFQNGLSFILNAWESVDLSSLAGSQSLTFNIVASADHYGTYGLNTPSYFALGGLGFAPAAVPEPSSVALVLVGLPAASLARRRRRASAR